VFWRRFAEARCFRCRWPPCVCCLNANTALRSRWLHQHTETDAGATARKLPYRPSGQPRRSRPCDAAAQCDGPERTQPRVCAALPPVAGTAPATYHGGAPGTGQRKQRLCGDSPGVFLFGEGLRKAVASVAVCLFACAGEPSVQLPDRDAQSGCRRRIDILRRHTETERASYSSGTIAKHFGVITDLSRLLVRMGFLSTAMDPRLSATALGES